VEVLSPVCPGSLPVKRPGRAHPPNEDLRDGPVHRFLSAARWRRAAEELGPKAALPAAGDLEALDYPHTAGRLMADS
jgi:hypothetical protein